VQARTFQVLAITEWEKGVPLSKSEFERFYMSQGLEEVYGNVGGDVEDGTTLVKNLTTSPIAQNL